MIVDCLYHILTVVDILLGSMGVCLKYSFIAHKHSCLNLPEHLYSTVRMATNQYTITHWFLIAFEETTPTIAPLFITQSFRAHRQNHPQLRPQATNHHILVHKLPNCHHLIHKLPFHLIYKLPNCHHLIHKLPNHHHLVRKLLNHHHLIHKLPFHLIYKLPNCHHLIPKLPSMVQINTPEKFSNCKKNLTS